MCSLGFIAYPSVPLAFSLICWPTVVASSLSANRWGFVLVDGQDADGRGARVQLWPSAFHLSFAELGSTVAELDSSLTKLLSLAAHPWAVLVLLDEGDALVERRAKGEMLLNSFSCAFSIRPPSASRAHRRQRTSEHCCGVQYLPTAWAGAKL